MGNVLAYIAAVFITLPIPMTAVLYLLVRKTTRNKKHSLHFTVNVMTLIYILAVHVTLLVIFNQSFLWYIFILLILLLSMFVILQWKYQEEVHFRKVWKGFWRFNFLLFGFSYIGLTIYGLMDRILSL